MNSPPIVQEINKHTTLQKRGFFYLGLCPFHNERTPSFCVDPKKESFVCFGCGEKGDLKEFQQLIGETNEN